MPHTDPEIQALLSALTAAEICLSGGHQAPKSDGRFPVTLAKVRKALADWHGKNS